MIFYIKKKGITGRFRLFFNEELKVRFYLEYSKNLTY
jgi:hypothetical protein